MTDTKTTPEAIGSIVTRLKDAAATGAEFNIAPSPADLDEVIEEFRDGFPGVPDETLVRICDREAAMLINVSGSTRSLIASVLDAAMGVKIAKDAGLV